MLTTTPDLLQKSQVKESYAPLKGNASIHLDAMRGLAALGVLANHWRDVFFVDYPQLAHKSVALTAFYLATGLGHQMVVIFFVLSGYLVGGSVLRQVAQDRWSWRGYLLNRLTRLYVVLIPALMLGSIWDHLGVKIFGMAGIYGGHLGQHVMDTHLLDRLSWSTLLGNYLFLHTILFPVFGTNGPLWSLSNEFWYYILFPFLVFSVHPRTSIRNRMAIIGLLVLIIAFIGRGMAMEGIIWLFGVLIYYLPPVRVREVYKQYLSVAALGLLVLLAATLAKVSHNPFLKSDHFLGIVVTALIYVITLCPQVTGGSLYSKVATMLSHSSYTLYLVHMPVLIFLTAWLVKARSQPHGVWLLTAILVLISIYLYAQGVYFLFEKRTDKLRGLIKPWVYRLPSFK